MPPIPGSRQPRIVVYYQTHHDQDGGKPISVLPLLTNDGIRLTHLIVAAIHLNEDPHAITLNDQSPEHPKFTTLWAEMRVLQASGVRVMGMLGGAAKGSYERLDGDTARFERYYVPLRDMVRAHSLDGLDLDVEEVMSLRGIVRLIDRLRADFGPAFIITLTPVATAMLGDDNPRLNLSGFGYCALDGLRGNEIAWYNTQFYCGWGDCSNPAMYGMIMARGWTPEKIVVGLVTSPENGRGWVPWESLASVLPLLMGKWPRFGGVMGWEYFNSLPGGKERPWEWAMFMTALLGAERTAPADEGGPSAAAASSAADSKANEGHVSDDPNKPTAPLQGQTTALPVGTREERPAVDVDPDDGKDADAPIPHDFEYYSDGSPKEN